MHDYSKAVNECLQELDSLNVPYGRICKFIVNYRATSRLGSCKSSPAGFIIEVSHRLFEDCVPFKSLKEVIIHEVVHTCRDCQNHGVRWKSYIAYINAQYGYNIQRTAILEEMQIPEIKRESVVKHCFVCLGCGQAVERKRDSAFTRNYANYRCGYCGGSFKKVL
jgi:predicted SprT family Zn-dependent metalloprotease